MNPGTFISILIFLTATVALYKNRAWIVRKLLSTKIPLLLTFLITAAISIAFEEQINCHPNWCYQVLFPPTLIPILLQVSIVGILTKLLGLKSILWPTLVFVLFGIWFEFYQGGLKGLSLQPELFFWIIWVGLSYAFVVIVPLTLLAMSAKQQKNSKL